MSEQGKGFCRWCDTQTNDIIKEYKEGHLVWVGCRSCWTIREKTKNVTFKK